MSLIVNRFIHFADARDALAQAPETPVELAWWHDVGRKPHQLRLGLTNTMQAALMAGAPFYARWMLHPERPFPWVLTLAMFAVVGSIMVPLTWMTMEPSLRATAIRGRRLHEALRNPTDDDAPVGRL